MLHELHSTVSIFKPKSVTLLLDLCLAVQFSVHLPKLLFQLFLFLSKLILHVLRLLFDHFLSLAACVRFLFVYVACLALLLPLLFQGFLETHLFFLQIFYKLAVLIKH